VFVILSQIFFSEFASKMNYNLPCLISKLSYSYSQIITVRPKEKCRFMEGANLLIYWL